MSRQETLEVSIQGMDCADCTQRVQRAITSLPGVEAANVFLASEKAVIQLDPQQVHMDAIQQAVANAGYAVEPPIADQPSTPPLKDFNKKVLRLFGIVFGGVLLIVVLGEMLGLFEAVTERVPWPIGVAIVLFFGYPVFRSVVKATLNRQIISHTLMSVGAFAALAIGEWATAAVVVFFMRVGSYTESITTEHSRQAFKDLTNMAPQSARVEREGAEHEVSIGKVNTGETIIVRPGEKIPVDGEVISGQATVNQASITGESMPVEVGPGASVFAATIANLGSLRIRTTKVGADTTFGRVVKLVEEAEAHKADVQRIADKFSAYYLPVVAAIAGLTFLLSQNALATAAVLVVACSCSFALATPIAMLASIGASAKKGLIIKGGKYLEILAKADVLLIDKTGTITLGEPQVTDVISLNGLSETEILALAASVERYSEHPLAKAVLSAAKELHITFDEPEQFEAVPGLGVQASVKGNHIAVGNRRMIAIADKIPDAARLEAQGKTLLFVSQDATLVGLLAASDTMRSEVPEAIAAVQALGIKKIELLTGDNERTAASLGERLGVNYRANLLPEDKITIVKEYQAQGHTVIMVGDGVNDAPALAQADVGIAMGAAGTDVAIEAAHIAMMRDDWTLVPTVIRIARRTMKVVKVNIGFTALYNFLGLTLAAFGLLPPVLAAAAQSLPDIGILANSSRLLREK